MRITKEELMNDYKKPFIHIIAFQSIVIPKLQPPYKHASVLPF